MVFPVCLRFSLVTAFQHPLAQAWALFLTGCEWISASPHALYELQGNNWLYHSPHHGLQRNLSSNTRSTSSPSLFSPTLVLPCWVSSCVFSFSLTRERLGVRRFICSQVLSAEKFLESSTTPRGWSRPGSASGSCSPCPSPLATWSLPAPHEPHAAHGTGMGGTATASTLGKGLAAAPGKAPAAPLVGRIKEFPTLFFFLKYASTEALPAPLMEPAGCPSSEPSTIGSVPDFEASSSFSCPLKN